VHDSTPWDLVRHFGYVSATGASSTLFAREAIALPSRIQQWWVDVEMTSDRGIRVSARLDGLPASQAPREVGSIHEAIELLKQWFDRSGTAEYSVFVRSPSVPIARMATRQRHLVMYFLLSTYEREFVTEAPPEARRESRVVAISARKRQQVS
jgi:hypothetical protein